VGILDRIVAAKKESLDSVKTKTSLRDLKRGIGYIEKPRDFTAALKRKAGENIRLIAEIKRASPSKGVIREAFDHISVGRIYEEKAVDAVSVLTEEDFFQGSIAFISDVRKVLSRPVLRKDFIFDEYQIYEARANEADAVLLIAAILGKNQATEYLHLSAELGMSVLFEVHDFKELETALLVDCPIIGINNRNLKTLLIDIQTTFDLTKEIPPAKIVVSESGIRTRTDVQLLEDAGVDAMLIGTSIMEAEDIGKKIDELTGKVMIE
jgi:indole-3-glycerol phosphate synthase